MAHKINDLTLGSTGSPGAITSFQDAPRDVTLALAITAAERRQLQEMAAHAGKVSETSRPNGSILVRDESPNGENLVYFVPDTTAATLVDEGWYVWADQPTDDFRGSTTVARMQASLKRICGRHNARGITRGVTEFLANDFSIADAKILQPLPPGGQNPTKSDGTRPTVILQQPAGENLLSNGGFESGVTGWTTQNSGTFAQHASGAKIGSFGALATRGAGGVVVAYASADVVPGVTYAYGGWLKNSTATNIYLEMQFYDSGGSAISEGYTVGSSVSGTSFAYTRLAAAAPPGAATVRCFVSIAGSAGQAGYVDALTLQACVPLVESPTAEPTAQGGTALATLDYAMDGRGLGPGDVKVFDMGAQTDATLAESSYTRVRAARHVFTGPVLLDNGIMRLHLTRGYAFGGGGYIRAYSYVDGAWNEHAANAVALKIGASTSVTIGRIALTTVSRGLASCVVTFSDGNVAAFTIQRGNPLIRIDTQRVNDTGGTGALEINVDIRFRHTIYNANTIWEDGDLTNVASVAGASLTEPYVQMQEERAAIAILAFQRKPTTLANVGLVSSPIVQWRLTSAGTTGTVRTFWYGHIPWPWLTNGAFFFEGEQYTHAGASSVADAAASGGNTARLDAQNEKVEHFTAVVGRDIPEGEYTLVFRAKDSGGVAGDLTIGVYNASGGAAIASASKTLTGSYAFYYLDFALTAAHSGITLNLRALKATATANNIDVDYGALIPRKRNSATPIHVLFPRDVARNALMATSSRETVIEA